MNKTVRDEELEEERDDAVIAVAVRYSAIALAVLLAGVGTLFAIKYWRKPAVVAVAPIPVSLPKVREEVDRPLPSLPMVDITRQAGITFTHHNGAAGEKLLPETMGGGCAFFDYDGDGDADILLTNSKPWAHAQPKAGEKAPDLPTMALYSNDGTGKFEDVTAEAGLDAVLYGQGCAVGDYDNDGDADLFISAVSERTTNNESTDSANAKPATETPMGPNRLYRNDDGKFVDVTRAAGIDGKAGDWGTSCGWFDYDNDADLDLWVCNYVDWSREFDVAQNFRLTGGERAYGRPQAFGGSYPHLYRNDGDGRFTEVSKQANIRIDAATTGTPQAKSLGLTFFDFDRDGNLDVLVANDTVQNNLFRNMGDGSFREMATLAGIAFDAEGNARGAMGIDVGCARDDPRCACVAIGNFANEMNALYVSQRDSLVFADEAIAEGVGAASQHLLKFGLFFFDY
ncbi:MAG: FG-GAP repeat domain-containing protein, partial [Planctomycetaceae bacterium]